MFYFWLLTVLLDIVRMIIKIRIGLNYSYDRSEIMGDGILRTGVLHGMRHLLLV